MRVSHRFFYLKGELRLMININIFNNSDELLEFLKTKKINDYAFYFEPLKQKRENKEFFIDERGIKHYEIDILVFPTLRMSKTGKSNLWLKK